MTPCDSLQNLSLSKHFGFVILPQVRAVLSTKHAKLHSSPRARRARACHGGPLQHESEILAKLPVLGMAIGSQKADPSKPSLLVFVNVAERNLRFPQASTDCQSRSYASHDLDLAPSTRPIPAQHATLVGTQTRSSRYPAPSQLASQHLCRDFSFASSTI